MSELVKEIHIVKNEKEIKGVFKNLSLTEMAELMGTYTAGACKRKEVVGDNTESEAAAAVVMAFAKGMGIDFEIED